MWKCCALVMGLVAMRVFSNVVTVPLPKLNWERRSDWLDVREFGAMGDGQTDDTLALQRAFNHLDNGVTVYLPPGRYVLTDTLRWRSDRRLTGVSVIGHGEVTQLVWKGPVGGRMVRDSGLSLSRYVGLVFDGQNRATVGMWNDQECKFETQVRYSYLAFRNLRGVGILCESNRFDLRSDSEPTFLHCIFEHAGTGVEFTSFNDYDFTFRGCLFIRNASAGIHCRRGNFYVQLCRFQENVTDILAEYPEHGCSVRRSVSHGSGSFLRGGSSVSPMTIENCTVTHWSSPQGAIQWQGALIAFNNCFLGSDAGKVTSVVLGQESQRYAMGNNRLQPGMILFKCPNPKDPSKLLPAGRRAPLNLPSDLQVIPETIRLPKKIFDAHRDFGAIGNGRSDDTEAIRRTIAAAQEHGEDAMAYFPRGTYRLTQTLVAGGGKYFIGGCGVHSVLLWDGDRQKHAIQIQNPQDIVMENIRVTNRETFENAQVPWKGESGANILQVGGEKPTLMTYDGVFVYGKYQPAGSAERQGILFRDLRSHDRICMRYLEGNQRYENAGNGIVVGGVCHEGSLTVDGPTGQGFLGIMVRLATHADHPLQVRKNGSFTLPDFYMEQGYDVLLSFRGGSEWPSGRVTLGCPKLSRFLNAKERQMETGIYRLVEMSQYVGTVNLLGAQFHKSQAATAQVKIFGESPFALFQVLCPFYYDVILSPERGVKVHQLAPHGIPPVSGAIVPKPSQLIPVLDDLTLMGELDIEMNMPHIQKTSVRQ